MRVWENQKERRESEGEGKRKGSAACSCSCAGRGEVISAGMVVGAGCGEGTVRVS